MAGESRPTVECRERLTKEILDLEVAMQIFLGLISGTHWVLVTLRRHRATSAKKVLQSDAQWKQRAEKGFVNLWSVECLVASS